MKIATIAISALTAIKGKFGPAYPGDYPSEMRTQLWPLCCGARIISGFKNVTMMTDDELVAKIKDTIETMTPDHQVFGHEKMMPKLIWLTLNSAQMNSKKIVDAVAKCGFVKVLEAAPRGPKQGFYILDLSETAQTFPTADGKSVEA